MVSGTYSDVQASEPFHNDDICLIDLGASLVALLVKNLPASVGDTGSIPGSGRSPVGGHGNPLLYSFLESKEEHGGLQSMGGKERAGYN